MGATLVDAIVSGAGESASLRDLLATEARSARLALRAQVLPAVPRPASAPHLFLDVGVGDGAWSTLVDFGMIEPGFVSFATPPWTPGQDARFRWELADDHGWWRLYCWLGLPDFVFS